MTEYLVLVFVVCGFLAWGVGGTTMGFAARQRRLGIKIHAENFRLTFFLVEMVLVGLILIAVIPNDGRTLDFVVVTFPAWVQVIAAVVMCMGGILNGWSRRHLGDNWVPGVGYRRHHSLTKTGPYKLVRHPMYTSYCIMAVTVPFYTGGLVLIVLLSAAWAYGYVSRIPAEEKILSRLDKRGYQEYAATTGALVPRFRKP